MNEHLTSQVSAIIVRQIDNNPVTVITYEPEVKHLPMAVLGGHNAAFSYLETNFDFSYLLPILGKTYLQLKRNNVLPYLADLFVVSEVDPGIEAKVGRFNVTNLRVPPVYVPEKSAKDAAVEELAAIYANELYVEYAYEGDADYQALDTDRIKRILIGAGVDVDKLDQEARENAGKVD